MQGNGQIEKVELATVLVGFGTLKDREIIKLARDLLPNAVDTAENFLRKIE